jgi:hypothetical protein
VNLLQSNKAVAEHLVEFWKKCGDLVFLVHNFNKDRQVFAEAEDFGCVQV